MRQEALNAERIARPSEDGPLGNEQAKDLDAKGMVRQQFKLNNTRMPVDTRVMLPEMIRTPSTMEKKTGTALTMPPGNRPVVEAGDLDQISAHHILGIRIRVLMPTVPFCSCESGGVFPEGL